MKNTTRDNSPLVLRIISDDNMPFKLSAAVTAAALIIGSAFHNVHAASPNAANAQSNDFAAGRIIVEPKAGLSADDFAKILAVHGGKARKLGQSNLHIVDLSSKGSERGIIEKLSHNPHLKLATLDYLHKSTFTSNDPYLGSEWHLAQVGATTAWDTTQGAGVTIAIVDSGVDASHPDLAANMVAGYNFYDNNTNSADVCGHGTAVAGTAAASINNGQGVAGVAGQSRIMPLRVAFSDPTSGCVAYTSTIASAITYAADNGARVANASFGGLANQAAIQSAGQYLKGKGGLLFVAAGNSGIDENMPATSTMIPVSATDGGDAKTSWSSYGSYVALSAPGAGIWSTSTGGRYEAWSGTSFASPLTAGVAALMMASNPALDGAQIEKLMFSTAVDLGAAGRDIYYGFGRVNAAAGVQAAVNTVVTVDTQAPTASISAPTANASVSGLVQVNVNAADNVGVTQVELIVNGSTVAVDTAAPFAFSWNSAGVANGMTNLVAKAYDAAGNVASSTSVAVNVANAIAPLVADTTPPVVVISNPVSGKVSGTVSVVVNSSDNAGAAGISQSLFIDGVLKAKGTGSSLAYSWNTRRVSTGTHTIQAVAKDAAGNTSSTSVQVTR